MSLCRRQQQNAIPTLGRPDHPLPRAATRRLAFKALYCLAVSKATLYLDDDLHRALRLKAAETRESMSELVNDALRVLLAEDLEDVTDWQQRRSERTVSYEEFLKQLAADGTI